MSENTTSQTKAAWIVAGGSLLAAVGIFAYLAFDQRAKYEQVAKERNQLILNQEIAKHDAWVRADERQKLSEVAPQSEASQDGQVKLIDTPETVVENEHPTQSDREAAAAVMKSEQDRTRATRAREQDTPESLLEVQDQRDREEATGQTHVYTALPPG
jgi:hypothetical protein